MVLVADRAITACEGVNFTATVLAGAPAVFYVPWRPPVLYDCCLNLYRWHATLVNK